MLDVGPVHTDENWAEERLAAFQDTVSLFLYILAPVIKQVQNIGLAFLCDSR